MHTDLDMPDGRHLITLRRQRDRIASGLELHQRGSWGKGEVAVTWGLCSDEKEAWPDAEDHLWPDEFLSRGRVAPKYHGKDQWCPFDLRRGLGEGDLTVQTLGAGGGCFYRCRVFQADRSGEPKPDRKRALELYDERIAEAQAKENMFAL